MHNCIAFIASAPIRFLSCWNAPDLCVKERSGWIVGGRKLTRRFALNQIGAECESEAALRKAIAGLHCIGGRDFDG
jgi:hypothetical protein